MAREATPGTAVVVGSGVSGLTTAVDLAEAGWRVRVVAADGWATTTSRVAGATWHPYLSDGPHILRWAITTFEHFRSLAASGVPGVQMSWLALGGDDPMELPAWAAAVGARQARPEELRAGWTYGFGAVVPMVAMGHYLPYLVDRLEAGGGRIESGRLDTFDQLAPAALVVNCSGLGSRTLAGDSSMVAVRGQIVVVNNPGLSGGFITERESDADDESTYAFAHRDEIVLGGVSERGAETPDVDPATAARIRARTSAAWPELASAEVIGHRVGFRPWRPTVRLEVDPRPPAGIGQLVHNYGHGGSGVTLSWGCASDVVALAAR